MVSLRSCSAAPLAQGIERLPPEQKAVGSNPTGGASLQRSLIPTPHSSRLAAPGFRSAASQEPQLPHLITQIGPQLTATARFFCACSAHSYTFCETTTITHAMMRAMVMKLKTANVVSPFGLPLPFFLAINNPLFTKAPAASHAQEPYARTQSRPDVLCTSASLHLGAHVLTSLW